MKFARSYKPESRIYSVLELERINDYPRFSVTIKILHIITSLSPDGAQRMLLRVASGMDKTRFSNEVVSLTGESHLLSQFQKAGIRVHQLQFKKNPFAVASQLLEFRRILLASQPDVLQGWMYHANLLATLGGVILNGRPVLWNIRRGLHDLKDDKLLTRLVVRAGSLFSRGPSAVVHCAHISVKQHAALGYAADVAVCIPNGFETARFTPDEGASARLKRELNLTDDSVIIGTVGRYHQQKDFPNLLQAAAHVVATYPKAHFVLYGRGVDLKNDALLYQIESLNLERNVHLMGESQQIPSIMPGFDIYCSSSRNEGFPNVVGEAMCCGLPCVVTDAGGSAEVVGTTGVVVPRCDSRALANGIESILGKSKDERSALGRAARERVLSEYCLAAVVRRYEALYSQTLRPATGKRTIALSEKMAASYRSN